MNERVTGTFGYTELLFRVEVVLTEITVAADSITLLATVPTTVTSHGRENATIAFRCHTRLLL